MHTHETNEIFLVALAQLRKVPFASSCLSFRPHGTTRLQLGGFSWNFNLEDFFKSAGKIKLLLKSYNNNTYFTWIPLYFYDHISFSSS
jgi:hypothetical protein